MLLAREVHGRGYKVALTGEGSDESLAGYPWYKAHKLLGWLGEHLGQFARRAFFGLSGPPQFSWEEVRRAAPTAGGPNAWLDMHTVVSLFKRAFYSRQVRDTLGERSPYEDLGLDAARMRRWHPLNRSLYVGLRTHLPGLLLSHGGDRIAMHSSVETRYPFLDEEVVAYLAGLHPRWKLHGFRDKYLLRLVAERWLPGEVAWRPKAMFRTPFDVLCAEPVPSFVQQLLRRGVAEQDGVLRRGGGAALAQRAAGVAAGVGAANGAGVGAGWRGRDAVVAPHFLWRRSRGLARAGSPTSNAIAGKGRSRRPASGSSTRLSLGLGAEDGVERRRMTQASSLTSTPARQCSSASRKVWRASSAPLTPASSIRAVQA